MAGRAAIGQALERLIAAGEMAVVLLDESLVVVDAEGTLASAARRGIAIDEALPYLAGLAPDLLNLQDEPEASFLLSNIGLAGPDGGEKVNIEAFWQIEERRYCLLIHKLGLRTAPEAEIIKQIKSRRIAEEHLQQTRKALAEQQTLVESIAENAPVALAILDLNLDYLFATHAWHELFRLGSEPLAGRALSRDTGPGEAFPHETLVKALSGQSALGIDATCRGQGAARQLLCSVSPWRAAGGSVGRLLLVATDLGPVLDERAQLRRKVTGLEDANRALEEFVAIAAHDLEAPRRAIDRALLDPGEHTLAEIASHSKRQADVLTGLLEHARLAGAPAVPEPVDLRAVAEAALKTAEGGAGFSLRCSPEAATVAADRVSLETIVRNLVANAVSHHDRSRGSVELTLDDLGAHWRLSIADDGPGIPEIDRQRIFEPFRQLEAGRGRGGSGLGLSLVISAARRMGGTIDLRGREGGRRGASFELTWPKVRDS